MTGQGVSGETVRRQSFRFFPARHLQALRRSALRGCRALVNGAINRHLLGSLPGNDLRSREKG
jgi:hypothetical protein